MKKLQDHHLPTEYSIREISIHKKHDFASTFFLMLHMYIAHMSEDVDDLIQNLRKLTNESNIVSKTKTWIASLISDPILNTFQKSSIPQWLLQIVYSEKKCISNLIPEKNRKNPVGEHNQLKYNGQRNIVPQQSLKKRKTPISSQPLNNNRNCTATWNMKRKKNQESDQMLSPILTHDHHLPPHTPISSQRLNNNVNSNVTRNMMKFSGKKNMNIFDSPEKLNNVEFKEFITQVSQMTINHTTPPNQLPSNHCVAKAYSQKILAHELYSLLEDNWLSDAVIDFMGKIIEKKRQTIHVYSTHFMSTFCKDISNATYEYSRVARWNKKLHGNVEFIYIPIHVNLNHWILSRLDFSTKKILIWNSSSISSSTTSLNMKYLRALKYYIDQVAHPFSTKNKREKLRLERWQGDWTLCDMSIKCPQQGNFDDCGVFTILNMLLLSSGASLNENSYSQYELYRHKTRKRITHIIFENIHWADLKTDPTGDSKWKSFINRMISKEENQNRWKFVNQSLIIN